MPKLSEMKNIEEYYEYYKIAIQKSPSWLEDVPDHLQTDELCKIAVKQNGVALLHVYIQTDEICKLAVSEYWHAFNYVDNKTAELRKLSAKSYADSRCKLVV